MAYKRYIWVDEESQLDAYHLNNIEDGLEGIIDGDLTVDKANKDGDGNIITGSYGSNVNFEFDHGTGIVTLKLIAKDGTILQTSSIDLPTEYLIKQIYLDDVDKNLVFVLSNDTEIKCDISAIYDKIDTKADKTYVDDIRTDLDTKLDTKLDKEYIVLTNTVIAFAEKINNDDAIILTNLYNKYEGITPEIPLFVRDKNNNIALLSFYYPDGLKFQVISNVSNEYFPIVSWQIGTTKSFSGIGKYYLHNILGQNAWEESVTAYIGIDSNYKLVLANNNKIIIGQNDRSVVVPPFDISSDTVRLIDNVNDKVFKFQVGSNDGRYVELDKNTLTISYQQYSCLFVVDNMDGFTHIKPNSIASSSKGDIKIPYKTGTMALVEDLANYTPISETNGIKALIPPQANKDNQLADKNFVNSSINSSAAYFIGSFATYADLLRWQNDNPTKAANNDYAYVEQDETHNNEAWRYIYVKTDEETVGTWKPQFKVNDNTPFTAAQLAAINSNITSDKVTAFDNHVVNKENPHAVTKEQIGLGNVDNTSDLNKPLSTATSEALENLNKVIPTNINLDSGNHLILEHDGVEITGQKKKVLIPKYRKNIYGYLETNTPTMYESIVSEQIILGDLDYYVNIKYNNNSIILSNESDLEIYLEFKNVEHPTILTDKNVKTINGESIYGSGDINLTEYIDAKLDTKVDKVEKTDRWQLYGVGDKTNDLPNGGTINAESNAAPYTVINRDRYGRAKIENPINNLDITNKQYVDSNFEKKTVLSNVLPTDNILLDLHNYQLESPITSDFSFIMPTDASDEYLSEISFTTGPTLVAFTTTSAITFTGEDCSNTHTFVPDTNKHYNIIFWKDKAGFQAVVRGY